MGPPEHFPPVVTLACQPPAVPMTQHDFALQFLPRGHAPRYAGGAHRCLTADFFASSCEMLWACSCLLMLVDALGAKVCHSLTPRIGMICSKQVWSVWSDPISMIRSALVVGRWSPQQLTLCWALGEPRAEQCLQSGSNLSTLPCSLRHLWGIKPQVVCKIKQNLVTNCPWNENKWTLVRCIYKRAQLKASAAMCRNVGLWHAERKFQRSYWRNIPPFLALHESVWTCMNHCMKFNSDLTCERNLFASTWV